MRTGHLTRAHSTPSKCAHADSPSDNAARRRAWHVRPLLWVLDASGSGPDYLLMARSALVGIMENVSLAQRNRSSQPFESSGLQRGEFEGHLIRHAANRGQL